MSEAEPRYVFPEAKPGQMPRPVVRAEFHLPVSDYDILAGLANKRGVSGGELIRQVVSTEHFFMTEEAKGSRFYMAKGDDVERGVTLTPVYFTRPRGLRDRIHELLMRFW